MRIKARRTVVGQPRFDGFTAFVEPMAHPNKASRLVEAELLLQKVAHTRHDQWMHVGTGRQCQRPHPRLARCVGRQQRVLRPNVVKVVDDGQ